MCRLSLCWYSIFCKQNFVGFIFGGFHLFVDGYIAFAWFWIYHIFHLELAVLSNFMARIPDKIKSIDGSRETLKLAVRITDLWFVGTPNKFEQAEMVIVDSEGDQIHAVCKADHLKSWKADLKENSTYVMHNFKVVKNDGQFRVCEHEYKLAFIGVTIVREVDLHELPFKEFRFVEFGNVVAGNFVVGLLVGSYLASVSNSFKASKLLINEPILEIQEFRESPVLPPGDQGSSQLSRGSQLSSKDAFLSKVEAKTIYEINGISEDVVCVTVGTISKIVMNNHSWCYPACVQCHRKTDIQTGPFTCGCGKNNDQPVLRYRVEVMVSQNNDSSKFLLWDRECAELIGQTVDEVNRVKIEDGDVDLNASPQALDRLLGYVLAFKVRIQSKFRNVVVLRCSNELDLINVVLDMLADTEACSKIDASNVDCNNATHPESDHDPVAGFPLTPKKRLSSDEVDDELGSSQISPTQLSSNKLTRHSDKIIASDSSESVNFESTQGSDSNFLTAYENCQSPTNQPIIDIEDKNCGSPRFNLCCGDGKVELSLLQNPPQYLQQLLFDDNTIDSKNYQHNLRAYNMTFAFTFAGIKQDKKINNSIGPPTIRIQGQPCHKIGSLLPMPEKKTQICTAIYL
ncbi:hypothetical protein HKD37_07G020032 [Glycine soja]